MDNGTLPGEVEDHQEENQYLGENIHPSAGSVDDCKFSWV